MIQILTQNKQKY